MTYGNDDRDNNQPGNNLIRLVRATNKIRTQPKSRTCEDDNEETY